MANIVKFPLNELTIDGYNLSDDEKDRIVLALQGKAVQNPVQESIDSLRTSITTTTSNISSFTQFDSSEQSQITIKLNSLSTAITNLETHTDIVSGVAINYTGFPPNFLGRLSMANSYNQTREALRKREDGPCGVEEDQVEIYSRMFRSILGFGQQEVEDIRAYLDAIDTDTIEYSDMNSYLTTAISNVNAFKTEDNQTFFEAYNFVNKVSVAQALINSRTDDFSNRLFDQVVGTKIFNTDDISNLKIQCQVWGSDTSTPPSDFSSNFETEFALTSIASTLDVTFEGWTNGYVLKFNTSGTLYPAPDDSSSGMVATGNYFVTGSFQFDQASLSIGDLSGRHTLYTDSNSGKIATIPNLDSGYFVLANTSGLGCSEGMGFFVTDSGLAEHHYITAGDIRVGPMDATVDDRIIRLAEFIASIDGGGSPPSASIQETGIEATSDFTAATLHGDVSGSITAAISKFSGGSTIAMGTVGLNSAKTERITNLASWNTTAIYAGDILIINWSAGVTLTRASLSLGRNAL